MPPRLRYFYVTLTAGLLLIPALAIYRDLSMRSDIWWTPKPMALSPAAAQDRVEIYVKGKPLGALIDGKQLWIADDTGRSAIGAQDIGLRLNNWDRVRVTRIPMLLIYAAVCGAGLVMVVLIGAGRLTYREERGSVGA